MNKARLTRLVAIADRIHTRQAEIAALTEQFEATIDAIASDLGLSVYDFHPAFQRTPNGPRTRKPRKNVSR
jgi:hypothetical protein